MTTTGVPAPMSVRLRVQAETHHRLSWVIGVISGMLLLIAVVRLWQVGDMPAELGVPYIGSALAMGVLGLAGAAVATGLAVVASVKRSAAVTLAENESPEQRAISRSWYDD